MATIQSIGELVYRQVNPNPKDEAKNTLEEYIESAKLRFAYRTWERNMLNKNSGEGNNIDGSLLNTVEIDVEDGKADISEISPLRMLAHNQWIQGLGGLECDECQYVVMDRNTYRKLCGDESRNAKYYRAAIPEGNFIRFPDGVHESPIELTYVNDGSELDFDMEIDGSIGALIQIDLINQYGGKNFQEDKTNDGSGNVKPG